jgi:4-amino-4-deoxy-L-arabinose transferase-like glycosyltransferase
MPLFYMFTWLLGRWGDNAFWLRLPSVVAGTLTVLAVYFCGTRLFGKRVGLIAAILTAVLPYSVWYAQEARNYALFMLLTTLQMYLAYGAVKRGRAVEWLGLAILTVLNLYNHYLALLTTAAVIVYVVGWAVAIVWRPASVRIKALIAAGLIGLAAVGTLVSWRPVLRATYGAAAGLIQRHAHAAEFASAVAVVGAVVIALALEVRLRKQPTHLHKWRQLELGLGAAALVVIAYVPWLPSLRVFLAAPDKGLGRLDVNEVPRLADLFGLAGRLDWSGFLLAMLGAGLVALVVRMWRGQARESSLLLCWLAVPFGLLLYVARGAIVDLDVRYLSFLFPATAIAAAAGVDGVGAAVRFVLRRAGRDWGTSSPLLRPAITTALIALVLLQALPALASSYGTPKDDWRGAAEHIAANSSPDSVVISVGNYSDWAVLCLGYYFQQLHAPIRVIDALQMTSNDVAVLKQNAGMTWGVVNHPSADQLRLIASSGDEITAFVDVTRLIYVVRSTVPGLSMLDQARRLLRWETPLAPSLSAQAGMLDLDAGEGSLGANLVPPPGPTAENGWVYGPGVSASGGTLLLRPNGEQINGAFNVSGLGGGDNVLVLFDDLAQGFHGSLAVYAAALDGHGRQIGAFPSAGFSCPVSQDWTRSYFAFQLPAGTSTLVLFFRGSGTGTAAFRSIQLSKLQ